MIDLAAAHFAREITEVDHSRQPHAGARRRSWRRASRADAITLNELPERLPQFDIIVTSTASSLPILGKGMLERAIKARRHAPMFIVDLAVPRDVEPEAAELDDVFLYSVDDLSNIVKDNLQIRVEAGTRSRGDDRRRRPRAFFAGSRAARGADDRRAAGTSRSASRRRARARAPPAWREARAGAGARAARARAYQQVSACADAGAQPARAKPSAPSCSRCCITSTSFPTNLSDAFAHVQVAQRLARGKRMRHPRESGELVSLQFCIRVTNVRWIPAFAGHATKRT